MTNSEKITAKPVKKRKGASLDRKKARAGWVFVLPFIIGLVVVYLPIIWTSLKLSFHQMVVQQGGGYELEWVGFENYQEAWFGGSNFIETLILGIKNLAFEIPAIIIFSLFMAILLNQKMAGRGVFRAIFFIPVILSTGLMESIDAQNSFASMMESTGDMSNSGSSASAEIVNALDIQALFANMKVGTELVQYVTDMINNIYGIVNRSGVQMLIFLAGLQSISPAIYESCSIDGATAWETFWKITLPMISPMILVNAVYTIIDAFTTESNVVMRVVLNPNVQGSPMGVGSAMGWTYFLVVALILAAVAGLMSAFVFYQKKK